MGKSRDLPLGNHFGLTIDRLRTIANESQDHLLLADGEPHPDAELLDCCAEILHRLRIAREAERKFRDAPPGEGYIHSPLCVEAERTRKAASAPLRQLHKRRATTPAGIFAKALVVRSSASIAIALSMSLADDLIEHSELRQILWAPTPVREA